MSSSPRVNYQTDPSQYKHWKLSFDGAVATLKADFDENAGLRPGYKLKLNSYDLGVDIELNDAINRVRFEHPEVRTVVVTSAKDKVFCSGANIFMLGVSSHAWKVNFCKFTNETRNGLEDSSTHSGLKFLAAVNGACAGGGYELALACDEIILVDDRSSAVSLPEVPLLGVLPGTGGLTRVTDKKHVRHDLADLFCTSVEGVRGKKAKEWRLVDDIAKPQEFAQKVQARALELAAQSDRPANGKGVALPPVACTLEADALRYPKVTVEIDRAKRTATFTVKAPVGAQPGDIARRPLEQRAVRRRHGAGQHRIDDIGEFRRPGQEQVLDDEEVEALEEVDRALLVGFGLDRVLADAVDRRQVAAFHRVEHPRQVPAAPGRDGDAPLGIELGSELVVLDVLEADKVVVEPGDMLLLYTGFTDVENGLEGLAFDNNFASTNLSSSTPS